MTSWKMKRSSEVSEDGCVTSVEPFDDGCLQPCLLFLAINAEGLVGIEQSTLPCA